MNDDDGDSRLRGSPSKNVFKRLSTSPVKKMSTNLNKSGIRASPLRRKPNWDHTIGFQTTPKRLKSPPYLQSFERSAGTVSVDRVHFSNDPNDESIKLSFPTSPVRTTYGNSVAPGGDGSLSRIRSRFSGGQRSPSKALDSARSTKSLQALSKSTRNLLPELQEHDSEINHITAVEDNSPNITRQNTLLNSALPPNRDRPNFKIKKPHSPHRHKTVKFEPITNEKEIKEQLTNISALLAKVMERQDQLEAKLNSIGHG
ncbi:LADA_0F02564g1_1 [Lachancea dasiensis]|uniref:LADA_0F02564g1_1 n=1 Tax=Lachancea dasiensis TaxID=1072105 RepID=A0A1G4JIE6_9SACH|nr:LADA_0F02564g1_1 [Lachancea dasiensis]